VIIVFELMGKVVAVVPITVPAQLSFASGAVKLEISHIPFKSGKDATAGIGAILSIRTTFCVCVAVLPAKSVYVHVIDVLDVIGRVVLVVAVTTPAQLSVPVGGVNEVIEQTPLMSAKVATSGTGAKSSPIFIICVCVEVFPFPSV
jgi:hypothetical protein